jgi:uncharacterized protein (DUF302 family)
MARLERVERALIDQGMAVPKSIDEWAALYERYKKDPFMLRTHVHMCDPKIREYLIDV